MQSIAHREGGVRVDAHPVDREVAADQDAQVRVVDGGYAAPIGRTPKLAAFSRDDDLVGLVEVGNGVAPRDRRVTVLAGLVVGGDDPTVRRKYLENDDEDAADGADANLPTRSIPGDGGAVPWRKVL